MSTKAMPAMILYRRSRNNWNSILLLTVLCLACLVNDVISNCADSSGTYTDKQVWHPHLCTVCTCDDPVPLCEPVVCRDPKCDYSKGQKIEMLPTHCCPVCSPRRAPCDFNGQFVAHGTEWAPSSCESCHCSDGNVQCSTTTCSDDPCRPGEIKQDVHGQCCSRCTPSGRACVDSFGVRRQDEDVWSPLDCVKCVCRNGQVQCMSALCPSLKCVEGMQAVEKSGQCCPVCEYPICHQAGQSYEEGELWKQDACTSCTCHRGQVTCRTRECGGNLTCSQSQVQHRRHGECCPQCVPKEGICFDEQKYPHYHGDMWKSGLCEFCGCSHGYIKCRNVKCGKAACMGDLVLTTVQNQCCPICTYPITCVHEGQIYQNGQKWNPDDCSMCTCLNGRTQCYKRTCPVCPSATAGTEAGVKREDCCDTCDAAIQADGQHTDSPLSEVSITVQSKAAPSLKVNKPLLAGVGEVTQLTTHVLDVSTNDRPEEVVFTALDGPLYGRLIVSESQTPVREFTLQDLMSGSIAYKHHGNSSVTGDLVRFRVADKHGRLEVLLAIKLQSQKSRIPVVMTNTGGLLHKGDTLKISPDLLNSEVQDTDHSKTKDAVYTLVPMRDNPRHGDVMMMVPTPAEGPGTGWTMMGNGMMGTRMVRFSQRDIDEGRIYYKHSGTDLLSDRFTFEVSDASNPPNVLRDQAFDITIADNNTEAVTHPVMVPGTKLGLTVMENQVAPITAGHLAFSDSKSAPENLLYKIISPLRADDEGRVERVDVPFSPLLQFTQADVNNRHVIYRPPDEEIGDEERNVSFTFLVSSGGETRGPPEYKFTIRIIPVNNNPPFFINPHPEVTMSAGGTYSLPVSLLEVSDPDNKLEDLEVIIKKTPSNGVVEKFGEGTKAVVKSGDKFPYSHILNSTLQYSHSGAPPTQDELGLVVSDGLHTTENIIHFNIIKLDKSIPTILSSPTFQINVTEGETEKITREHIAFADVDSSDNQLLINLTSNPSQGHFQVKRSSGAYKIGLGDSFSQADINEGLVSFIADTEIGLKSVSELLYVNVSDSSGNVLPNQIVSLHITPMDNLPPTIVTGPDMQVEEGGEAALTTQMISVLDADSSITQVMFVVETPPHFGILQNRKPAKDSEIQKAAVQFPYTDVIDGHIYYLQSEHKSMEPAQDAFLFSVNDGNNRSPVEMFNISIQLINDEPPAAVTEQLFVGEGKAVPVTNHSIYVVDLDTPPKDLIFTIINTPMQGSLLKKEFIQDPLEKAFLLQEKSSFSYQDVLNEVIIYSHDDGETNKDSIVFYVTDGEFGNTVTLSIIIGLVSDETPRVTVNRGLRVQAGTTTVITQHDLQASDLDSDSLQIVYTVMKDPSFGHLQFNNREMSYILSEFSATKTFQQSDIDKGCISFVHEFGERTGNMLFKFKLTDPEGNALIDQDFFITVVDDHRPPFVVSNKEFVVTEGAREKLTTDFLSFSDEDIEPGSLGYTVMEGPDLGHLELLDQPGVPIITFTQANLAANKVIYVHTSTMELTMDQFTFAVSDGKNKLVQVFFINIQPVDDAIPVLSNNGLRVQEGVRKLITEFDLKAVDQDTEEHMIMFAVVKPPEHGSLNLYTSGSYKTVDSFTMEDIYESRVSYQHGGGDTTHDAFTFLVSDGTNKLFTLQQGSPVNRPLEIPQTFAITVLLVDDGVPIVETNLGLQFLESKGSEIGKAITSKELLVTDEDTPSYDIMYIVTSLPKFGFLENTRHPGQHITSFTQKDINSAKIKYRMTKESSNLQDSFQFDVMDKKPNVVPGNRFYIMWSEISIGLPFFNITETQRVLQVPVVRRGNLKQYSIVECATVPGTATSRSELSRPGLQDFILTSGQVQFDSWQDSKTCTVIINDDSVYEGPETFYVQISSPTFAVLGDVRKATVTVHDEEDKPTLQFLLDVMQVKESDQHAVATVIRSGDVSDSVSVICSTNSLTATGSSLTSLESGSDFISRGYSSTYRVVFPPGVTHANCSVKLIDDSMYEGTEQFELQLSDPSIPATLGALTTSLVIIDGPNDVSHVYLAHDAFAFPENSGTVELEVLRTGSDLSHSTMVWCATRMSSTVSATPGQDYVPSSMQLTFGPGQRTSVCRVGLLDDDFEPKLEGNETFVVFLSSAVGSILVQPHYAEVTIYDDHLDIPQMTFSQDNFVVDEKNRTVNATIIRTGDVMLESSAICYTRQLTAEVATDYDERPFSNDSRIVFKRGERSKSCVVNIVDDEEFEHDEVFQLKLGSPQGSFGTTATLGELSTATVTITNYDDVPTIQFEQSAYSVHEPSVVDQTAAVRVKVIRTGSVNETSSVRCSTRDGSAQSGSDYNPKSLVLLFEPGVREMEFSVDVLYNTDVEWHQSFKIQLGPEEPTYSVFGSITVVTITVLDNEVSGSLVLPAAPMVMSLLHYGNSEQGFNISPSPGYPLVCVTPCDVQYPDYSATASLCEDGGINQTSILYQWEIALPQGDEGVAPLFVKVTDKTLFTSVDNKVLDSVYFRPYFQVRCVAQPLQENGNPGIPLKSRSVTIGTNSICKSTAFPPTRHFTYQAQSFLASLEYIPPDRAQHGNTVHISIQIPHQDGMLPLISTQPLQNLRLLLSESVYRQQHVCSNVITAKERPPFLDQGFLGDLPLLSEGTEDDDANQQLNGPGFDFPYQFDKQLRERQSLLIYRHLNLKSCIWMFDAWYHMTELVDLCGGHIVSDFQVMDKSDSHLTIRVPLYVSYVYATAPTGWGSLEHRTEMEVSFYYSTVLWKTGLSTEGRKDGRLQVVRILIGDDGKLVLEFRTQAKFRGQFVLQHHTLPGVESRIVASVPLATSFNLDLVWSQNTFDSPFQVWKATSQYSLKDYTGIYHIELIPCLASPTQSFVMLDILPCTAQQPQRFEVPMSFQQTNHPVPVIYSLNTEFQLTNSLQMFLLNPATKGMENEDWNFSGIFSKGQKLYGRVLWNPEQDLKTTYKLVLQKVFLCTGNDGFIPTYDPTGETYGHGPQYGCIQPSKKLLHRFLILDRESPDMTHLNFHQIPFNAQFAYENDLYSEVAAMPGVDGFVMDIDPLYKAESGYQWYLQVVYRIGSMDTAGYRIKRSSVSSPSPLAASSVSLLSPQLPVLGLTSSSSAALTPLVRYTRYKREMRKDSKKSEANDNSEARNSYNSDIHTDESHKNGTNIKYFHLIYDKTVNNSSLSVPVTAIAVPISVAIIVLFIVIFICLRKRRRKQRDLATAKAPLKRNNQPVVANSQGHRQRYSNSTDSIQETKQGANKSENRNSVSSISKCNIIRIKDNNIKSQYGNNVENGTEV